MTRRPQLIAMGDNCLDVYLSKDRMAVGGNALNVAAQWRLMGLPARYFGVVGEDSEGDVILDGLAGVGLSPEDIERRPGSTAVTLIRDKNGDRSFLLEDLGVGFGYVPDADRQAEMLAADWLHLGTNTDAGLVCLLVSEGARFSVDVSTRHDDLPLAGVPLAFASGPEDPSEPIEPVLAAFRARGALNTLVTCGSCGAYFDSGSAITHVPAHKIAVVDTCGAGDSFAATFLARYIVDGLSVEAAMQQATVAAAATCLHEGGFPQPLKPIPLWLFDKYSRVIVGADS
jgi:fructoselysine 6-kinase